MLRDTPLRILVAVGNYPPDHGGGGLRAHRTYRRLARAQPLSLTACADAGRGIDAGWTCHDGVSVVRLQAGLSTWRAVTRIATAFRRPAGLPEIVHAMGLSQAAKAACVWAIAYGIPIVRELTMTGSVPAAAGFGNRVARLGFTRARLVVARNASAENAYLRAGINRDRIWCQPNPVDTSKFAPPTAEARAKARRDINAGAHHAVHLVLARFTPRKGQQLAVDAMASLPAHHRLLLAGPVFGGDATYLARIRGMVESLGLGERVLLLPDYIDDPTPLFHAADTCWIPSQKEGLPNVMIESLCCGLPVVANEILNLGEHIKPGWNGSLAPPDPTVFAKQAEMTAAIDADTRRDFVQDAKSRYGANHLDAAWLNRLNALADPGGTSTIT